MTKMHRQQPAGAECDGAARRTAITTGRGSLTCWTTSRPVIAPGDERLLQCRAGEQAASSHPTSAAGSAQIYIYPEEIVCLWASRRPAFGQVGGRQDELPDRRPWPRPCHGGAARLRQGQQHDGAEGRHDRQSRRLHVALLVVRADLSHATLLSGQYKIPSIHANVRTVYTNTAPVDAIAAPGGEATYLLERVVETAARELGVAPAELRPENFIRGSVPDAGHHVLRRRRLRRPRGRPIKAADYDSFFKRRDKAKKAGKLRGIGMSCHRGLRHRRRRD